MSFFSDATESVKLSQILTYCQQRQAGTGFVTTTSGPQAAGYASVNEIARHFRATEAEIESLVNTLVARASNLDGLTFAAPATTAGARRYAFRVAV